MGQKKQNLPRGITIREHTAGSTINITFTFKGVRCREPLSSLPVTSANLKYAERLLSEILGKIERGTFNYADYFPASSKLKIFGNASSSATVLTYLDDYLKRCEQRGLSPSTIGGYKKCRSALASLHSVSIQELTPAIIKTWVANTTTTAKTARNNLSFLRSAIDEAVTDGLLPINPVTLVSVGRYKGTELASEISAREVDPFTPAEVDAILTTAANINEQWANLFRFAFATGMRSSELCALRWQDIDMVGRTIMVRSAMVVGVMKGTKTRAGSRTIELTDDALLALNSQKRFTFLAGEFVFHDPKLGKPWAGADAIRKKAWVYTLKRAGARYRHPYQTRHTFATANISRGCNLFWLASQMGHKGPEMLFRHYGSYLVEYDGMTSKAPNLIRK